MQKGSLVRYRPLPIIALRNQITDEFSYGIVLKSYFLFNNIGGEARGVKELVIYDLKYAMKVCLDDDMFIIEEMGEVL